MTGHHSNLVCAQQFVPGSSLFIDGPIPTKLKVGRWLSWSTVSINSNFRSTFRMHPVKMTNWTLHVTLLPTIQQSPLPTLPSPAYITWFDIGTNQNGWLVGRGRTSLSPHIEEFQGQAKSRRWDGSSRCVAMVARLWLQYGKLMRWLNTLWPCVNFL